MTDMKKENERFYIDWFLLILGCVLIALGVSVFQNPKLTSYGYDIDLGNVRGPLAIAAIGAGIYSIWLAFTSKRHDGYYMCIRCDETFTADEANNKQCPRCQHELEPLEGFYDRHPEMRDSD